MRALLLALSSLVVACGNVPNCPATTPANGSSCNDRGFVCESGGGPHERCSTISTCSNSPTATWSNQADAMCSLSNDVSCAADYGSNQVGGTCPTAGVNCDYSDGRCSCVPCGSATGTGYAWQCRAWTDGIDAQCPSDRPALGSPCTVPSLICNYDNRCTVSFGPNIQCFDKRWQPLTGGAVVCPTPTCGED